MKYKVRMLKDYYAEGRKHEVWWKGEVKVIDEIGDEVHIDALVDMGYCEIISDEIDREIAPLYVVANVDENGNIVSYPKGGGSSSPAYIRAFESLTSAKRSKARMGGAVIKITGAEVVE